MYRHPDSEREQEELERAARAQSAREERDAAEAREAAVRQALLDLAAREEEDAAAWQFAKRVSPLFSSLVASRILVGIVASLVAFVWLGRILDVELPPPDIGMVGPIGVAGGGVLVVLVLSHLLNGMRVSLLASERAWARAEAFGMTGHIRAIAGTSGDENELAITIELTQAIPTWEERRYADALASLHPTSSVSFAAKRVRIDSGILAQEAVVPWCRRVVSCFVSTLETFGIDRITMTCK